MKKTVRAFSILSVLLLFTSAVLCGCKDGKKEEGAEGTLESHDPAGTPVYGGSAVVGITQDLDSLDPHKAVAAGTKEVLFNIFEGLVKPDKDANLVPAVAEGYTISEDAMVYTFTLRQGVQFHNGEPVTAEDVIYSIKRSAGMLPDKDPALNLVPALSCIESISAARDQAGKDVVSLQLNTANTELLGYLTVSIIPKDYDNQAGHPIGTGPFRFVSYTPLGSIVLEKNQQYYIAGLPYLDEVTFKISANTESAFFELMAGNIDVFPYLTEEQASQLHNSYTIKEGDMYLVQALFLNNAAKPFDDPLVRQALFYAVDVEEIQTMVGGGRGTKIRSNFMHGFGQYYNAELDETYSYDVDKAKELLAQAGYPDGFSFTIHVPSNYQIHVDTTQVIAEQLKKIGVDAEIQLIEWASWLSEVYKGRNYQATVVGLDAQLAPSDILMRYLSDASNNFLQYQNREYDRIFQEAYQTLEETEKEARYQELQSILNADAASVYIQNPPLLTAINPKLAGYAYYPIYVIDMSIVYFTE